MTGGEDQAQQVVADVIVQRGVEVRHGQLLLDLELATELLVLALEHLASTQPVDRAILRGGHEPGARVVRNARLRPLLQCGDECVLRELLGKTDVSHDPRQAGDDPRRLDPPNRVDRAMGIGSRHLPLRRSSCSRSAGSAAAWTSGVKSSNSCTWRTSIISSSE